LVNTPYFKFGKKGCFEVWARPSFFSRVIVKSAFCGVLSRDFGFKTTVGDLL